MAGISLASALLLKMLPKLKIVKFIFFVGVKTLNLKSEIIQIYYFANVKK